LLNQACTDDAAYMEGERRSRNVQAALNISDRQAAGPGFNQETQDFKAGAVPNSAKTVAAASSCMT
jgi:hypothetical protein